MPRKPNDIRSCTANVCLTLFNAQCDANKVQAIVFAMITYQCCSSNTFASRSLAKLHKLDQRWKKQIDRPKITHSFSEMADNINSGQHPDDIQAAKMISSWLHIIKEKLRFSVFAPLPHSAPPSPKCFCLYLKITSFVIFFFTKCPQGVILVTYMLPVIDYCIPCVYRMYTVCIPYVYCIQ